MSAPVRVTVVTLVIAFVLAASAATALALPGQHLWQDWVYTSGVYEDEEATAIAIAPGGHPVVVGTAVSAVGGERDIRYVSYDAASLAWRWNEVPLTWGAGAGTDDTPAGVVIDAAGNAYVAGTSSGPGGGSDIVLLKVLGTGMVAQPGGTLLWKQTYDGPAHRGDEAEAVAIDAQGNVYVTGGSRRADGSWDMVTAKFRPNGTRAWVRRHNNGAARLDRGLAIAVQGGSVYVAGVSRRRGHADDVVLVKYGTAGKRMWVRYYDDTRHRSESVSGIACSGKAVYVCGAGLFTAVKPGQALLLKYDAGGKRRWARFAGSQVGDDSWADVAVDGKGFVHVTGTFFRSASADDVATSVYRPNGKRRWRAYFTSSGSRLDAAAALAVDAGRRTYVAGRIEYTAGDSEMLVLCYPPTGVGVTWYSLYPDPANYPGETDSGDDWANDIALVSGAAYVVGAATVAHPAAPAPPAGESLDFQTVKLAR